LPSQSMATSNHLLRSIFCGYSPISTLVPLCRQFLYFHTAIKSAAAT
jgi:hypothetical protein